MDNSTIEISLEEYHSLLAESIELSYLLSKDNEDKEVVVTDNKRRVNYGKRN